MLFSKTGDKFGGSSEIKNTVVYGGVPKHRQVRDLRSGIEIVIATPVRFTMRLATSYSYKVPRVGGFI